MSSPLTPAALDGFTSPPPTPVRPRRLEMSRLPGTLAEAGAGARGDRAAPAALGPRGRPAPSPLHLRGPSRARTLALPLRSALTCDAARRDPSIDRKVAAAEPAGLAPGFPLGPRPHCSRCAPSGSQRRRRLLTPGSLRARRLRQPLPQLLIGRSSRPSRALIGQPRTGGGTGPEPPRPTPCAPGVAASHPGCTPWPCSRC